jgi:hypothetical protein
MFITNTSLSRLHIPEDADDISKRKIRLLTYIDQCILSGDKRPENVIHNVCKFLGSIYGTKGYAVFLISPSCVYNIFIQKEFKFSDELLPKLCAELAKRKSRPLSRKYLPDIRSIIVPDQDNVLVSFIRGPKAVLRSEDSFFVAVARQISVLVDHYRNTRILKAQATISNLFFDNKLQPTRCWEELTQSVLRFAPGWACAAPSSDPSVQLLLYNKDNQTLRIVAATNTSGVGKLILVNNSVTGMMAHSDEPFLVLDPRHYSDIYKRKPYTFASGEINML